MSQTLHQIYQNKAIVLARTMVVKFHSIAESINQMLMAQGYEVDPDNPATWKYYLNMFGEYHQYDKDRLMALSGGRSQFIQIKVAGETQAVDADFTKELLYGNDADIAVANEYRFNTHYYKTLVTKYPEFEDLILGVLNPVPIDISLDAQEGEILYCGGYLKTLLSSGIYHYVRQDYGPISENFLIESNEENLITILQEYIYNYLSRWWNANYAVTNDLFHANFLGLMMLTIPQILGNIRLGNAKSPMAHTFHIREHLESVGNLGWVSEYLSKGVLLWIYRNLLWLDSNRGKQMAFDAIIDNVLEPTNIPISGYRLRHDVEDLDTDNLSPEAFLEKIPLNYKTSTLTRHEIIDIINAEVQLATENYYDQDGQTQAVKDASRYSMFDNLNTKVLESTVTDLSNHMAITREDVGLNLWCYAASHGLYRGSVIFTNPLTNERMQLTPLNAYILALYCFNMGWANFEFKEVPTMYSRLILRHPEVAPEGDYPLRPTLEEVKRGLNSKYITDEQINNVLGNFTPDFTHGSTGSFANEVTRTHTEALRKYEAICRIEDAVGRGQAEWIAHQCYWYDIPCPLTKEPTSYSDWLVLHGIDFDGFSRNDYITLGMEIVQAATGVDLESAEKLRNKQTAALAVLKHFSSYTIQIIQNSVASDSYWLDWKTIRASDDHAKAKASQYAQVPLYNVREYWSLSEGPIWLREHNPENSIRLKEKLVQRDDYINTFNIAHVRLNQVDRAKIPMYTVIDANIPDIYIERRVKKFATITSMIYPVNTAEKITATITQSATMEVAPRIVPVLEKLNPKLEMTNKLWIAPRVVKEVERLDATAKVGNTFAIVPRITNTAEELLSSATVGTVVDLIPPFATVQDTLEASAILTTITLTPEHHTIVETLNTEAVFNNRIGMTAPNFETAEELSASVNFNPIIVIDSRIKESLADKSDVVVSVKAVTMEAEVVILPPAVEFVMKMADPEGFEVNAVEVSVPADVEAEIHVVHSPTNLTVEKDD